MDKTDFSQNFQWAILVIDHKCCFYRENQQNPTTGFGEIDQNDCFWAKMGNFDSFGAKMGQTGFFCEKAKMSLPYTYYAATLCKKPEQTYERILRSRTDKRTDGQE